MNRLYNRVSTDKANFWGLLTNFFNKYLNIKSIILLFPLLNLALTWMGLSGVKSFLEFRSIPPSYAIELFGPMLLLTGYFFLLGSLLFFLMVLFYQYLPRFILRNKYERIKKDFFVVLTLICSIYFIENDGLYIVISFLVLSLIVVFIYYFSDYKNVVEFWVYFSNAVIQWFSCIGIFFIVGFMVFIAAKNYIDQGVITEENGDLLIVLMVVMMSAIAILFSVFNVDYENPKKYVGTKLLTSFMALIVVSLIWAFLVRGVLGRLIMNEWGIGGVCASAQVSKDYIVNKSRYDFKTNWLCKDDLPSKEYFTCVLNVGFNIQGQEDIYIRHNNIDEKKYVSLAREYILEYKILDQKPTEANGCMEPKASK